MFQLTCSFIFLGLNDPERSGDSIKRGDVVIFRYGYTCSSCGAMYQEKAALKVLMYSYATGRKMLDYSGFATTVFERYEDYRSVKEEFGIA